MINLRNKLNNSTAPGESYIANRINKGTSFIGDIKSDSDIRIDGEVKGNIYCMAKVVIGEEGICLGDIVCAGLTVAGRVVGTLEVNGVFALKKTAGFEGDVHYEKLIVEEGATVSGSLTTRPLKKIIHTSFPVLEAVNA